MTTLTKEQIETLKRKGTGTPTWSDNTPTVITADKFVGDLEGNADTATRFKEPSRLTLTGNASGHVNIYGSDANNLEIHVTHSDDADHAEEAERAKSTTRARYADLANLATLSEKANLATKSLTSVEATHAESADLATRAQQATHATEADHALNADLATRATNATHAISADTADTANSANTATTAGLAQVANLAKALDFTIVKVVSSYPAQMDANALYVLVDNNNKIIGIDTKNKVPVDFDLMTIDVLPNISESTFLKTGKLYAVPTEDGTGTKLDPKIANVLFKTTVSGIDVYYQVGGSGGGVVLPEASTTQKGIVQLSNTISNDETKAVTPKCINDLKDDTFVTMSTAQYVYATKTELNNRILSTSQYIDGIAQSLSSAIYNESQRVDNNFVTLSTAQYITNLKTFNSILPQSTLTPTDDKDFTTKKFIDNLFNEIKTETARASVTFGGVDKMTFTEE